MLFFNYLPALKLNKEDLFVKNFDKPYWTIINKFPIDKIKIDKSLFSFNNEIDESTVNMIVSGFDLIFWIPVTINKDFYLLDGQHRLEAARRMNLKYIDVAVQDQELMEMNKSNKKISFKKFIL